MDLSLIILIIIFIILSIGIMLRRGWKDGTITLLFIFGCIAIYTITLKLWGEEGKKYLAVGSVVIAAIVLYVRKKRGQNIWW